LVRTYYRIFKAVVYLAVLLPPTIILKKIRFPGYKKWPHRVHKSLCSAFNVDVAVFGEQIEDQPTLFVSNHVSWVDILVLGGVLKGSFIAKDDMSRWPVLGYMATLQRTIFINREKRTDVSNQKKIIQDRLMSGDNLILFPEGTTSEGGRVLAFNSSLFGVAEFPEDKIRVEEAKKYIPKYDDDGKEIDQPEEEETTGLLIQPVTIVYRRINNMPAIRTSRPLVAWFGDMAIGPHFKKFIGLNRVEVEIHFHQPVSRNVFKSRKELSSYCQRTVANKLIERLRGGVD
jgi:1-acyl-sn-glycerol-3-phosphate acyltransferase